jgi:hypothetical protein
MIHIREYSWVVDGDECHLDEVREWVVIVKLREVFAIVD